jgi:hypothetical protein
LAEGGGRMARIVLSQRLEYGSDYRDIPFKRYHFKNKNYGKAIHTGDAFVYVPGK